jgi:hypothetical protein
MRHEILIQPGPKGRKVGILPAVGIAKPRACRKSGVSLPTIQQLEAEGGDLGGRPLTGEKIIVALEKAGG